MFVYMYHMSGKVTVSRVYAEDDYDQCYEDYTSCMAALAANGVNLAEHVTWRGVFDQRQAIGYLAEHVFGVRT